MCTLLLKLGIACSVMATSMNVAAAELPRHLHDTGLYEPGSLRVRAENMSFTPQYSLWSDGASKQRWIYLPPGSRIDASDPDAWEFPRGTKLWKEFRHGRAIETRFIERRADGSWQFASYVWNEAGTHALLAPEEGIKHLPASTAPDGVYPIPARADCLACHEGGAVPVLGFSALQLSTDRDPLAAHAEPPAANDVDLRKLIERGSISPPPRLLEAPRIAARSPVERAALGYLHANCGHCHNDIGPLAALEMLLSQSANNGSAMQALENINNVASEFRPQGRSLARLAPGDPSSSVLAIRMRSRNLVEQMPPLGTRLIDVEGVKLIARWIEELSSQSTTDNATK